MVCCSLVPSSKDLMKSLAESGRMSVSLSIQSSSQSLGRKCLLEFMVSQVSEG
jgi:hypothetical protein